MKFNSAKKTRQHDVDKFMKLNKVNEFAEFSQVFIAQMPLFPEERKLQAVANSITNVLLIFHGLRSQFRMRFDTCRIVSTPR